MTELAKRRPTRLKGFDYGVNEVYFVTICTHNGQNTLSEIVVLDAVICAFKSLAVWNYKKLCSADKIWQRSFHDHIIRNEKDYSAHWDYIDNNPTLWDLGKDEYVFSEEKEQIL